MTDQTDLKNALDNKANINDIPTKTSELQNDSNFVNNNELNTALANYQEKLVSGTNIKSINNQSILGNGNIEIESEQNYSLQEQRIGTWKDGKPLYRKVVEYTHTNVIGASGRLTDIIIPHNISNFKNIIQCTGFKDTGYILPVIGGGSEVISSTLIRLVSDEGISFRIINDAWQPATWTFILLYTKTTD